MTDLDLKTKLMPYVERTFKIYSKEEALKLSYSISSDYTETIYNIIRNTPEKILYVLTYNFEKGIDETKPLHIDYHKLHWGSVQLKEFLNENNIFMEYCDEYIIFVCEKNE
jgi:hypothetical protein